MVARGGNSFWVGTFALMIYSCLLFHEWYYSNYLAIVLQQFLNEGLPLLM